MIPPERVNSSVQILPEEERRWTPKRYAVIFRSVLDGTWRIHLSPNLRDARAYRTYALTYEHVVDARIYRWVD